jgi:hypothetical protein
MNPHPDLAALLKGQGFKQAIPLERVLQDGIRYRCLVSEHYLGDGTHHDLMKQVGERNVRFMYAQGKNLWNFAPWNRLYDLILCFGPYQAARLAFAESTVKVQMGYPRYDDYFTQDLATGRIRQLLGCDPAKPTMVWLPTWKELSSLDRYREAMADMARDWNVVVKPHPLSLTHEPARVAALRALPFTKVVDETLDNLYLYAIAERVVCDYGGTPFGALYLDRPLLLLNMPGAAQHRETGEESADVFLRETVINLDDPSPRALRGVLADEDAWSAQRQVRARLREIFFAPYYGFSGQVAALVLENLGNILG